MKTFTHFENTIINNIDFEGYGLSSEMYLYDKIKTLYNIFKKEYINDNNRYLGERKNFADWLQGLPSVLTVPFYYHEILDDAKKAGFKIETEAQEDNFCDKYWSNLSNAFFTLLENL